jgi:hypothetical protein
MADRPFVRPLRPPAGVVGIADRFGALALPCYSLAAAHAYDKTPNSEMVPTTGWRHGDE